MVVHVCMCVCLALFVYMQYLRTKGTCLRIPFMKQNGDEVNIICSTLIDCIHVYTREREVLAHPDAACTSVIGYVYSEYNFFFKVFQ